MAVKVLVNYTGSLPRGKAEAVCQQVADALGILAVDVVFVPEVTATVVEVPDALVAKRDKADKEAAAEKAKADKAAAELQRAQEAADREKQAAEQAKVASAQAPAPAPAKPAKVITESVTHSGGTVHYDSWTMDALRKEAKEKKVQGADTMERPALISALVAHASKGV